MDPCPSDAPAAPAADSSEAQARLAGILRASPDCIITVDHQGRVLEFNPAAETTFGFQAGEVVGRGAIAEHVWDSPFESMSNVIDVMIQRLRRKIDDPDGTSLITTRRGEGYMLAPVTDRSGTP